MLNYRTFSKFLGILFCFCSSLNSKSKIPRPVKNEVRVSILNKWRHIHKQIQSFERLFTVNYENWVLSKNPSFFFFYQPEKKSSPSHDQVGGCSSGAHYVCFAITGFIWWVNKTSHGGKMERERDSKSSSPEKGSNAPSGMQSVGNLLEED